jgi:PAS domain-containing protein
VRHRDGWNEGARQLLGYPPDTIVGTPAARLLDEELPSETLHEEGGRGLLLVAQMTRRWGTRHADGGKTIWAEQILDVPQPGI